MFSTLKNKKCCGRGHLNHIQLCFDSLGLEITIFSVMIAILYILFESDQKKADVEKKKFEKIKCQSGGNRKEMEKSCDSE